MMGCEFLSSKLRASRTLVVSVRTFVISFVSFTNNCCSGIVVDFNNCFVNVIPLDIKMFEEAYYNSLQCCWSLQLWNSSRGFCSCRMCESNIVFFFKNSFIDESLK